MYLGLRVLVIDDVLDDSIVLNLRAMLCDYLLHEIRKDVIVHLDLNVLLNDSRLLSIRCLDLLVQNETPEVHIRVLYRQGCILLVICFPDLLRAKILNV